MGRILSRDRIGDHPFFEERPIKRELAIVMTGDRGLCGGFNSNIHKELQKFMASSQDKEILLYPIGKVGNAFIKRRGWNIFDSWIQIGYAFTPDNLNEKVNQIVQGFLKGEFDRVSIISMKLHRSGIQECTRQQFLNMSYLFDNKKKDEQDLDYIFEPEPVSVLKTLINLFIKQRFYTLLLQSVTAEYFARMVAMKQATDNGKEVIQNLTLERNKVRQAMITREISEIIGGANALN